MQWAMPLTTLSLQGYRSACCSHFSLGRTSLSKSDVLLNSGVCYPGQSYACHSTGAALKPSGAAR
eukprot:scaffold76160_cov30-Tisochrysis_lutea.AAC.2